VFLVFDFFSFPRNMRSLVHLILMSLLTLVLMADPSAGSQQTEANPAPSGDETTQKGKAAVDEKNQEDEELEEVALPLPPPPDGLLPVVEVARFEHSPRERPHLLLLRDLLIVVTRSGLAHGIDLTTGELQWKLGLPGEELFPSVILPPQEDLSLLLSTPSGRLFLIDGRTGRIQSEKQLPFPLAGAPFVSDASILYAGTPEGVIHGFDLESDTEIFATAIGEPPSAFASSGNLLAVSGAGQTLTGLDPVTGVVKWTHVGRGPFRAPATFGDDQTRLYIGSDTGEFYCLDAITGKVKFKWATGASIRSPALVEGDRVYVSSYANAVYAYGARNGHEQWRAHLPGRPASGPFRLYQRLMVATRDGMLIEIEPTRGHLGKSHIVSGEIPNSPVFHIVPAPPIAAILEEPESFPTEALLADTKLTDEGSEKPESFPAEALLADTKLTDEGSEEPEEPKWYELSRIAIALRSGEVLLFRHLLPELPKPETALDAEGGEGLAPDQTGEVPPAASPVPF
jgi:hypothetical protein